MSSIPSVEALEPLVMVPGEKFVATADVRPLIPKSTAGALLESIVSLVDITSTPSGLTVDTHAQATFDSSTVSLWVDAAAAQHGASYTITITFKTRAAGAGDGSQDRTRKAVCPVVIRSRNL